ncbi:MULTISPECIES: MFS transporter [unclassified Pseudomonas]|jgi:MFS family permease|uniref:MFS transporter n=1 Tax=unclassified Pseudomonas TaxID=196821 RepID=UPI001A9E27A1|nr:MULTISPECIES: MFS transporter [unclassified Pseudomonas]
MKASNSHLKSMWVLLIGSALSTFGIFLSIPLVSMHAYNVFHLSVYEIGLVSGVWPATVFFFGFICGMIGDRWGYVRSIRTSAIINCAAFLTMAVARDVETFVLGLVLFGIGKSFFDSTIRAAMTCVCLPHEREKYFRLRYMLMNIGCVVGPLVGVYAYEYMASGAFTLTSVVYVAFFLLTMGFLHISDFKIERQEIAHTTFGKFKVLKDFRLLCWVAAFALVLMAYGSYEAFMPIIVEQSAGLRPSFGILVSLNAAVVIIFQVIHLRYMKWLPFNQTVIAGIVLLVVGFLIFTVDVNVFFMSLLAVVVFSIGETLLFPCFEVFMDKIAPAHNKALYFGAGEVKQIGFFLGPLLGGVLFTAGGSHLLIVSCALCIALAAAALYQVHASLRSKPVPNTVSEAEPTNG